MCKNIINQILISKYLISVIKTKSSAIIHKNKILQIILVIIILLSFDFNKPSNKPQICLCAIGKKENLYVEEFVEHYKKLGYDKIFIYDNNDKNDENLKDVLDREIYENFVSIIDFQGYRGKSEDPQIVAYYDCYEKNYDKYDWFSFFDIDEFLEIKNNKSIKQFLSDKKFKKCYNIIINWIVYTDNNLVYYDDRKIQERFTEPLLNNSINRHVKSTIRGKRRTNYWRKATNSHRPKIKVPTCTQNGERLSKFKSRIQKINYDNAYIKHYNTKTIEEFIIKIKRGKSIGKSELNYNYWNETLHNFFKINKVTEEKLNYIRKEINISFSKDIFFPIL